ncbi:hypothetical protein ON010_g4474 [Phytophthora cinnamomi]|nr:hypothetical protein ON010_g4474 [Phytophthora cinnamomi]
MSCSSESAVFKLLLFPVTSLFSFRKIHTAAANHQRIRKELHTNGDPESGLRSLRAPALAESLPDAYDLQQPGQQDYTPGLCEHAEKAPARWRLQRLVRRNKLQRLLQARSGLCKEEQSSYVDAVTIQARQSASTVHVNSAMRVLLCKQKRVSIRVEQNATFVGEIYTIVKSSVFNKNYGSKNIVVARNNASDHRQPEERAAPHDVLVLLRPPPYAPMRNALGHEAICGYSNTMDCDGVTNGVRALLGARRAREHEVHHVNSGDQDKTAYARFRESGGGYGGHDRRVPYPDGIVSADP